jgi:thiol-disulfide isomerase/thioredoxin
MGMVKKRHSLIIMLMVALASAQSAEVKPLAIGAQAPDFNLPGVDGKNHTLQEYASSDVLVIIFTCNHCPTAQAYEERLKDLYAAYTPKGVAFVAVSPNDAEAVRLDELGYSDVGDSLEDMKVRAKEQNFPFPYLYDGNGQQMSKAYGPQTTPHVFIFDKERKLRFRGRIDDNERIHKGLPTRFETRDAIDALLANKPVAVETTMTTGCSIKWADKRNLVQRAFESWAKEPVELKMLDEEELKSLAANRYPQGENQGKAVLITVWATWCGPCVEEFEQFVEINRMYRNRDFRMVSINIDAVSEKEKVLAFLKKQQASFTNYLWKPETAYQLMGLLDKDAPGGIPYTLFIKPGGEILYRHFGPIDAHELKRAIVGHLGRVYP